MKLLVISPVFPPLKAGESDYAYHLCRNLVARGISVDLLTGVERDQPWARLPGVTVHPIMKGWGWKDLPRLAAFYREHNPQATLMLYIGWLYEFHPMATYLPAFAKRWAPEASFVTLFYNRIGAAMHSNPLATRFVRKFFSLWVGTQDSCYEFGTLLTVSDRTIVFAEKHGEWLRAIDEPAGRRMDLVPALPCLNFCEGACREKGRERLGAGKDDFVVSFFGFVYFNKGIEHLMKAFAKVLPSLPHARLAIIGGVPDARLPDRRPYKEELLELAATLKIEGRVTWTGEFASESDVGSRCLYASDAAVFPFDEGIALNNSSVAAAANHGLPLISTLPAKLESAFRDGENILLCPPRDPEALASAILRVATEKGLAARLRAGAEALARDYFSWDRALDTMLSGLKLGSPAGTPQRTQARK